MAVLFLTDVVCRKCGHSVDTHLSGLSTGLGPPKVRCSKCAAIVRTGRVEWVDFTAGQRLRYVAFTLLGASVLAFLGGIGVRGAYHFQEAGPWKSSFPPMGPGLVGGAAAWALATLLLQWVRVIASTRRTAGGAVKAYVPKFPQITIDIQLKLLALPWVPTMISWAVAYLRAK